MSVTDRASRLAVATLFKFGYLPDLAWGAFCPVVAVWATQNNYVELLVSSALAQMFVS